MNLIKRTCENCRREFYSTERRRLDRKTKLLLCSACYSEFKRRKIRLKEFDFTEREKKNG